MRYLIRWIGKVVLAILFATAPVSRANGETLAEVVEPWFYGTLGRVNGDLELEFATPPGPLGGRLPGSTLARGSAFALPGQLVVDLPMLCQAEFREVMLADPILKRWRYGQRKGQTRVIVDLRSKETPRFVLSFNEIGNRLAVRFDLGEGDLVPKKFVSLPLPTLSPPEKPARMDALVLYDQFKASTQELVRDREVVQNTKVVGEVTPEKKEPGLAHLIIGAAPDSKDGIGLIGLGLRIALVAVIGLAFLANVRWDFVRGAPRRSRASYDGLDRTSRSQLSTYYQLLNVSEHDSNAAIKSRYRELVKQFHSDTFAGEGMSERGSKIADERFRQIDEAYRALKAIRGID